MYEYVTGRLRVCNSHKVKYSSVFTRESEAVQFEVHIRVKPCILHIKFKF